MLQRYSEMLVIAALMAALYVAKNQGFLTVEQVEAIMAAIAIGGAGVARRMKPPENVDDGEPPKPKHRTLVGIVLGLVVVGCGAVPTGNDDVDEMVNALCEEHGALCVGTSTKADLGLDEYLSDFYWGKFSYGEIELPGSHLRYGVACYDDEKCAEDLDSCAFVVLHEIGHQKRGSDQTDADCWAAENATAEQTAAGIALVCSFNDPARCQALKECAS